MVSKEEFNKVFKDTSREGILNQFYYEHIELGKMIDNFNELEKWLEEDLKQVYRDAGYRHNLILEVLDKLHELKEKNKFNIINKPTFTTSSTSGNRPLPPKQTKGSGLIMGTSTNFKIESYKDIKNYIHNYLGLTKDEVMSIIKEVLVKSVKEEITKILNDENRLRILINDCISREISNQSKERRCYMHSMMDEIYRKIDEEIHKQVTDKLLISLKESKEDNLESQV